MKTVLTAIYHPPKDVADAVRFVRDIRRMGSNGRVSCSALTIRKLYDCAALLERHNCSYPDDGLGEMQVIWERLLD